jgi:type IV pilus assembly protein PilA
MLHKLRERAQDEKGFTLIELLVVILIIGILAAIALPAFLNQRGKAQDSEAKSAARTAQTAMETYYTDNQDYQVAGNQDLIDIEPAVAEFADRLTVTPGDDGYTVSVTSNSNGSPAYSIQNEAGDVTRACPAEAKGCKDDGSW